MIQGGNSKTNPAEQTVAAIRKNTSYINCIDGLKEIQFADLSANDLSKIVWKDYDDQYINTMIDRAYELAMIFANNVNGKKIHKQNIFCRVFPRKMQYVAENTSTLQHLTPWIPQRFYNMMDKCHKSSKSKQKHILYPWYDKINTILSYHSFTQPGLRLCIDMNYSHYIKQDGGCPYNHSDRQIDSIDWYQHGIPKCMYSA